MKNTKIQNPSLRKRKGFTLIELIVVIAILAILAAIAIPAFIGTLTRAKTAADQATERVIISAVKVYYAEKGTNPTLDQLKAGYLDPSYTKWSDGSAITAIAVDGTTGVVSITPDNPTDGVND